MRTDSGEKRQEGISFLLIDMKTPGITVRPLILMDGAHEVNEVFFDDVKVPVENLVFQEGKGWTVAKYLLGYERMNTGRIGESKRQLAKLKKFAAQRMGDMRFRDRLTRLEVELMALEITNLRFLDRMRRTGQPPGADVSMLKIKGTEIQQGLTELMMQAADPAANDDFSIGDPQAIPVDAQDDDLRRLERDPEEHHCQDDVGLYELRLQRRAAATRRFGPALPAEGLRVRGAQENRRVGRGLQPEGVGDVRRDGPHRRCRCRPTTAASAAARST